MNQKEKIIILLLAAVNFTHILDFMIMMPLGNLLMPLWKMNTSQFAKVVSCYPITAFASSFAAIFFADKFNRKHLLLVAYGGFVIATFCCGFATSYHTMMIARVFTGLFGGLIGAQVLSIIGDFVPYERRGQAMGLVMSGFAIASIIGVPMSLYLANKFTWQFPFYFIATLGFFLWFVLYKKLPNFTSHMTVPILLKERVQNFISIFKNKTQVIALAFSSCLMMGHFFVIPLINPYMVHNALVPQKYTPLIYLVGGTFSIISANIFGKMADKIGKYKIFIAAVVASVPLIWMVTNMPTWPLWAILSVFGFWFAASTVRSVPSSAMVTQSVPASIRGSFMSINSCLQSLGTGIATLTSGLLTSSDVNGVIHGYPKLGYISIAVILLSAFIGSRLNKKIQATI